MNEFFKLSIPSSGVTDGHIHFDLERVDPQAVAVTGVCANVIASLLFERMGAQGSNIICTLGPDHGTIDVLSRSADDGLGLTWEPLQIEPEKLNETQAKIQDKTFALTRKHEEPHTDGHEQKPSHPPAHPPAADGHRPSKHHDEGHGHHLSEAEEEAFVKQITRIP